MYISIFYNDRKDWNEWSKVETEGKQENATFYYIIIIDILITTCISETGIIIFVIGHSYGKSSEERVCCVSVSVGQTSPYMTFMSFKIFIVFNQAIAPGVKIVNIIILIHIFFTSGIFFTPVTKQFHVKKKLDS